MKKENQEVSVFICSGCSIGESLDCENLKKLALENKSVSDAQIHSRLCHKEGLDLIHTEIQAKKAQKILIAACSPRAKTKEFSFDPSIQVERTNLREQVVYCHPPQDEDTQMMAEDYIRMGLAKLEFTNLPTPYIPETSYSDILVVGGGISGLTAALSAADAGYSVILIEKEGNLGGFLNTLSKSLPNQAPWNIENEISIANTIREAIKHPDIRIITSNTIASINGQPGEFEVRIDNHEYTDSFHVGAIVLASGWKPYDPSKLGHLGYGASQDIITSVELEKLMKDEALKCTSSNAPPKSVLFIQCAGSRDEKHLPYCSNICCGTSLKQARMIRQKYPDCQVFIIYKDYFVSIC